MNTKNINNNAFFIKVCFLALVMSLSACSDRKKIATDLQDYNQRLQSYTGIELTPSSGNVNLGPPGKSSLNINIEPININLREFYAFNDCGLNQLVAQRNTALGKMQLPSSRYAYESALINELLACQQKYAQVHNDDNADNNANNNADNNNLLSNTSLDDDKLAEVNPPSPDNANMQLVNKLKHWENVKQQQLPAVWANLITQSTETIRHFSAGTGFISGSPNDNYQATKQALQFLVNSQTQHPVNISDLELHLKQMNDYPLLAQQWRTQLLLTQELNNISMLLTKYLEQNTCSNIKEEQSIDIMKNIFRIFFADLIQPVAGQLNRYSYGLSALVEQIASSPSMPKPFSDYLRVHNEGNHQAYKQSMQAHITIWQEIFKRCDKAPS